MSNVIDMTGQKFGRLTVISRLASKHNRATWLCQCDCGNRLEVIGKYLRNGDTKSCGCLNIERIKQMGKDNILRNTFEIVNEVVYVYFNNTQNYFTCDKSDIYLLNDVTWFESEYGYARAYVNGKYVFFHNQVLGRDTSLLFVCDHIDGNRLNNQKTNLRVVTRAQNAINRGLNKNNTSGITGVSWDKGSKKWIAYIQANKEFLTLGYYDKKYEAVNRRKMAEKIYFGEYRRCAK